MVADPSHEHPERTEDMHLVEQRQALHAEVHREPALCEQGQLAVLRALALAVEEEDALDVLDYEERTRLALGVEVGDDCVSDGGRLEVVRGEVELDQLLGGRVRGRGGHVVEGVRHTRVDEVHEQLCGGGVDAGQNDGVVGIGEVSVELPDLTREKFTAARQEIRMTVHELGGVAVGADLDLNYLAVH